MATDKAKQLAERVRRKPNGRTTIKLRTLLSDFGHSRRSSENVERVRRELAGAGILADFSVDSPKSLDDRIPLLVILDQAPLALDRPEPDNPEPVTPQEPEPPPPVTTAPPPPVIAT